MSHSYWTAPSEGLPLEGIDKIEIFRVVDRSVISEEGWPESFWPCTSEREVIDLEEIELVKGLFNDLEEGVPARCHMPPWGLAMYRNASLIFTSTLCFECSNSYIYSGNGKTLTAFLVSQNSAEELLNFFKSRLPID